MGEMDEGEMIKKYWAAAVSQCKAASPASEERNPSHGRKFGLTTRIPVPGIDI